jgi:hypothetical protein
VGRGVIPFPFFYYATEEKEVFNMSTQQKFLSEEGVKYLWSQISMQDYPNNETLISVINAIDETKADRTELPEKPLIGTTLEISPNQILIAMLAGR